MITLTLHRFDATDLATLGFITDRASKQLAVTLELPDRGNAHNISRIPAGTYRAVRFASPKRGYDVFKLVDVPDRDDIELHRGNTVSDTDGCILLGTKFGSIDGRRGVLESKTAFDRFMDTLHGVQEFTFVVIDPIPPAAEHAA